MLTYDKKLKTLARGLRKEMTESEQHLWSRLRRKQLLGVQFYRQKPLGRYNVDFHAPAVNLVIEIDGSQHLNQEHAAADRAPDAWLREHGLRLLRFDSSEVLRNIEGVLEIVFSNIQEKFPHPPFKKGGSTPPVPPLEKGGRRGDLQ
ncbi:MAG TPA: endonuclease domain-containing protein [Burkholderiales bacterium]